MTAERTLVRQHCAREPNELVTLPARELLGLINGLEDEERKGAALREHLKRRHGCGQGCHGMAS